MAHMLKNTVFFSPINTWPCLLAPHYSLSTRYHQPFLVPRKPVDSGPQVRSWRINPHAKVSVLVMVGCEKNEWIDRNNWKGQLKFMWKGFWDMPKKNLQNTFDLNFWSYLGSLLVPDSCWVIQSSKDSPTPKPGRVTLQWDVLLEEYVWQLSTLKIRLQ